MCLIEVLKKLICRKITAILNRLHYEQSVKYFHVAINHPDKCLTFGQLVEISDGAEFLLYGGRCNKTDLVI
jgi:hypothetical protein